MFLNYHALIAKLLLPPKDIMVDLETVGMRAGHSILSIGAVAFQRPPTNLFKRLAANWLISRVDNYPYLSDEFYVTISRDSCLMHGLTEDEGTVIWWADKPIESRIVFDQSEEHGVSIHAALIQFREYLTKYDLKQVRVWGCGAEFDNPMLFAAYDAVGMEVPWAYTNNRCYRTLKGFFPKFKITRFGIYHNALDDAKDQAIHAYRLLSRMWFYGS